MTTVTRRAPHQGVAPAPPRKPRLTWRQRLSQADVKWSPYLYVAPFFILFGVVGLFPLLYTSYLSLFDRELLDSTNDYFGDVKVGQLFATMAQKVGKAQYKGPGDGKIQENATSPALQAVEAGKSPEEGWRQAVDAAKKIVK